MPKAPSSRSSSVVGALALALAMTAFGQAPATPPAEEKPVSIAGEIRNSMTLAPIERAHVSARRFINGKFDRYGVLTNAEGKFVITNIPAGTYYVYADRTGFTDLMAYSARETKLGPGEKKEDFKLKLVPTGEITGRVLDRDGAPMKGLIVSAESGGQVQRTGLTDDRGMFRMGGVTPGKYRVIAEAPRDIPSPPEIRTDGTAEAHYSPTYYPNVLNAKSATRVEVGAGGSVTGVEIRLVSTPILRIGGKVSGFPPGAQNVTVSLSKGMNTGGNTTRTRPDGTFEIWRVHPGKYTLRAEHYNPGNQMWSAPMEIEIGDTDVENIGLQLVAPSEIRGTVEFDDEDARKLVQPPASKSAGTPAASQQRPSQTQQRYVVLRDANLNTAVSGQIQEDGSFTLPRVQPGMYRATISAASVYVKAMQVRFGDARLDLRSGAAGAPLTLHVASATGTIGGVVRGEKGPAGESVVAILAADAERVSPLFADRSKEDGSYTLTGVAPGKYRIGAYQEASLWSNDDVEDFGEVIEVREHETVSRDLKMRPMPGAK